MASLCVEFGGVSRSGIKPLNQDAFAVLAGSGEHQLRYKGVGLAIADGISGGRRSQEASQMVVTEFLDQYFTTEPTLSVRASAARVLDALNTWLFSQNANQRGSEEAGLVTTFTALVIKGRFAQMFHIGDSRVYLVRERAIRQLSTDHSHRVNGRTCLMRALGVDRHADIEHRREELEVGDLLLLSTDGLHGHVSDAQLLEMLTDLLPSTGIRMNDNGGGANQALEAVAEALVERALSQGSEDNISCVLARVWQLEDETRDQAHARLSRRAVPPILATGITIDHYRVIATLHASPRSHLYLVEDTANQERRVLKAPSLNLVDDLDYLQAFTLEHWVALQLDSPTVIKAFPTPRSSRFMYAIYEYIDGQTLRQWMIDNPHPSLTSVRTIAAQLIDGLRALQRRGIVHRDLKPENIMLDADGRIRIVDLGAVQIDSVEELAPPRDDQAPLGTSGYMAPETVLSGMADMRSDLYALGCIVQEMLSGEPPYRTSGNPHRIPENLKDWQHRRDSRSGRPDLPLWIELALAKATAIDADRRYASYSEFLHALSRPGTQALREYRSRPFIARHPVLFWQLLSAALLVLVVFLLAERQVVG